MRLSVDYETRARKGGPFQPAACLSNDIHGSQSSTRKGEQDVKAKNCSRRTSKSREHCPLLSGLAMEPGPLGDALWYNSEIAFRRVSHYLSIYAHVVEGCVSICIVVSTQDRRTGVLVLIYRDRDECGSGVIHRGKRGKTICKCVCSGCSLLWARIARAE